MIRVQDRGQQIKEYGLEVARICLFNVICQSYVILFCGKLIWKYDIKYIIIFAWFMDLFGFINIILDKKISKFMAFVHFVEKVLNVVMKILIVVYLEINCCIELYYTPIVQLLISIGLLFRLVFNKKVNKKKHKILAYCYFLLYHVQIILLTLKWSNRFDYSLNQTFIIAWTVLGINCFLIILMIINTIENFFTKQSGIRYSLLFWLIFYISGLTFGPFILLRALCQAAEDPNSIEAPSIVALLIITSIYVLLLILLTYKLSQSIVWLLRQDFTQQQPGSSQEQPPNSKRKKAKKEPRWKRLRIPLTFLRVSGTYFQNLGNYQRQASSLSRNSSAIYNEGIKPDSLQQSPCQTIVKQIKSTPKDHDEESCVICFENEQSVVLVPCNHGGLCQQCADNLMATTKQCYMCRGEIKLAVKLMERDGVLQAVNVKKL